MIGFLAEVVADDTELIDQLPMDSPNYIAALELKAMIKEPEIKVYVTQFCDAMLQKVDDLTVEELFEGDQRARDIYSK